MGGAKGSQTVLQIIAVVDEKKRLVGTVTPTDLREVKCAVICFPVMLYRWQDWVGVKVLHQPIMQWLGHISSVCSVHQDSCTYVYVLT